MIPKKIKIKKKARLRFLLFFANQKQNMAHLKSKAKSTRPFSIATSNLIQTALVTDRNCFCGPFEYNKLDPTWVFVIFKLEQYFDSLFLLRNYFAPKR